METICIVVPCYNEATRLPVKRFEGFTRVTPEVSFIFVNDGSTDLTEDMIMEMCSKFPDRMSLLSLDCNRGKAEAVRRGVLEAVGRGTHRIGFWDADLSTPLEEILEMNQILNRAEVEIVTGARFKAIGRNVRRKAVRHYLGRVFATIASLILQLPYYDTQCGAKLFKNNERLRSVFNEPFRTGWAFDVEMIARFLLWDRAKGRVRLEDYLVEHPLAEWIDYGGSKIRIRDFFAMAQGLAMVYFILHRPDIAKLIWRNRH